MSISKVLIVFILVIITSCQKDDLMFIDNISNNKTDSIKSVKLSHLINKLPDTKIKKKKRLTKKKSLVMKQKLLMLKKRSKLPKIQMVTLQLHKQS